MKKFPCLLTGEFLSDVTDDIGSFPTDKRLSEKFVSCGIAQEAVTALFP